MRWRKTADAPKDGSRILADDALLVVGVDLPGGMPGVRTPDMASTLPAFPREGQEIGGSGI